MKQFTISPNQDGIRLSRFVHQVTWRLPSSLLHKSFRNRRIKLNGHRATPETTLHPGDLVQLYLNDEFFTEKPVQITHTCIKTNFGTVYEDPLLAILYKPTGLLTHSDEQGQPGLLEGYIAALQACGDFPAHQAGGFFPAVCTRLDRNTEGLVLVAKTHPALRQANQLIREGLLTKKYLCITLGAPPEGLHNAFLRRDLQKKQVRIFPNATPDAKAITTEVHVQETCGQLALCEIGLHTGRTHQIRAHLAALGTPLLGDTKYGLGSLPGSPAYTSQGQALCAHQLHFSRPLTAGTPLAYLAGQNFTAPAPAVLAFWETLCCPGR